MFRDDSKGFQFLRLFKTAAEVVNEGSVSSII